MEEHFNLFPHLSLEALKKAYISDTNLQIHFSHVKPLYLEGSQHYISSSISFKINTLKTHYLSLREIADYFELVYKNIAK